MTNLNEKQRKDIENEAKKILDNFANALSKVKTAKEKKKKEGVSGFRIEKEGKKGNEDFRERMFSNAPHKTKDNIIAETKAW